MKDVFGKSLLNVYKEQNKGIVVAAKTKLQAIEVLLEQTNFYSIASDINLISLRKMGYASTIPRIW